MAYSYLYYVDMNVMVQVWEPLVSRFWQSQQTGNRYLEYKTNKDYVQENSRDLFQKPSIQKLWHLESSFYQFLVCPL